MSIENPVSLARPFSLVAALLFAQPLVSSSATSTCYGTVGRGSLENAVELPREGTNFRSYSLLGPAIGRTFVHSEVREIILDAYRALEQINPDKVFVYGETGRPAGGRMRPHRTHENGLSVDFMVPIVDRTGRSVPLPTGPTNRFGYDIEFDKNGRFGEYTIDFEALGEHLYRLDEAAKARGHGIALVIFDPPFLPKLFATRGGEYLRQHLPFLHGKAWWRHDEHYHVDFAVPCKPRKK
jgi:penicillin-insensitive murein endopeptidase